MNDINHHISYQDVIDSIACHQRSTFPAEFHGFMCGIICGGNYAANEAGFRMVLDMLQDYGFASENSKKIAAKLMLTSFHQLHDLNGDFKLLLPDENSSMVARSKALVGWCQNFLSGLGLAGVDENELQQDDVREALYDISEIAKLYCGKLNTSEREAHEFELMELVEYVRVAALLIYTESLAVKQPVRTTH